MSLEDIANLIEPERLMENFRRAGFGRASRFDSRTEGGLNNDRYVSRCRVGLYACDRFATAHHRQTKIHEDEVWVCLYRLFDRLMSGPCLKHLVPEAGEGDPEHAAPGIVVFRNEDFGHGLPHGPL
jgi:hypothetical protein